MQMMKPDKDKIAGKFSECLSSYDAQAHVQRRMAENLADMIFKTFGFSARGEVLEAGCGSGIFTARLLSGGVGELTVVDIADCSACMKNLSDEYKCDIDFIRTDAEVYIKDCARSFCGVFSSAVFQWFHNLPGFISDVSGKMKKDGMFGFATFGPLNLREVRSLTKTGLDYHTKEEIVKYLADDYRIIHVSESSEILYFDTPFEILKHLKETGTNSLREHIMSKSEIGEFVSSYETVFYTDGKFPLTYNPLYFIAEKK